jgi:hypothetical protein
VRTNAELSRRLGRLARHVESIVSDTIPNLFFASRDCEAEQLQHDAKNFVFALRDARNVLKAKGGAA